MKRQERAAKGYKIGMAVEYKKAKNIVLSVVA